MKINLQTDAESIYAYVKQRVADYPNSVNAGPGTDDDPISQITLGYQVSQAGWIALVFDTRPDGSPDGVWQSYIEENWVEYPNWFKALEALWNDDEPIELVMPDGEERKLGDDDLSEIIGVMLKDILLQARQDKCFDQLPLASKSSMGVEDHDGAYGWPDYEQRYVDGRIVQ